MHLSFLNWKYSCLQLICVCEHNRKCKNVNYPQIYNFLPQGPPPLKAQASQFTPSSWPAATPLRWRTTNPPLAKPGPKATPPPASASGGWPRGPWKGPWSCRPWVRVSRWSGPTASSPWWCWIIRTPMPPRWPDSWRRCTNTGETCRGWCCLAEHWKPSPLRMARRFRAPVPRPHPLHPAPPLRVCWVRCGRGSAWNWSWDGRAGGSTGWSARRAIGWTPSLYSAAGSADEYSLARTCGLPTGSDILWSGRGQTVKNLKCRPHWKSKWKHREKRKKVMATFFFMS